MAKIVVAEEQSVNQYYLRVLLTAFGHTVHEASYGNEALGLLKKVQPDLLISDVLMRAVDGYELVKQMRGDPTVEKTPVIYWVAESYKLEATRAAPDFAVKFVLSKPSIPEDIISAVNAVLSISADENSCARLARFQRHRLIPPADPIDRNSTVFIVDDDVNMCAMLSGIMRKTGLTVETYATAEAFLEQYHDVPGCLLLDAGLPGMSGLKMLDVLRSRRMYIPAIILTGQGDIQTAQHAVRLRALDFLEKPVHLRTLLARVYYGLQHDSIHRSKHAESESITRRMASLTIRERDLVELLITGHSSKQIAQELQIALRTVANHRSHVMAKTGAVNLADLVRMSMIARVQ